MYFDRRVTGHIRDLYRIDQTLEWLSGGPYRPDALHWGFRRNTVYFPGLWIMSYIPNPGEATRAVSFKGIYDAEAYRNDP